MELEGKVSLWLGNFNDEETFRSFMEIKYTDDGDSIPSDFKKHFQIKSYDIDFSEIDYMEEEASELEVLLEGFSNDYEIIPKFKEYFKLGNYNAIVLLYDFQYEKDIKKYTDKNSFLEYIGCVSYTK